MSTLGQEFKKQVSPQNVTGMQQRVTSRCKEVTNVHLNGGRTVSTRNNPGEVIAWLSEALGEAAAGRIPVIIDDRSTRTIDRVRGWDYLASLQVK